MHLFQSPQVTGERDQGPFWQRTIRQGVWRKSHKPGEPGAQYVVGTLIEHEAVTK